MVETLKMHIATVALSLIDGIVRIAAVITLEGVNTALATVIAVLSIVHLAIKIRNEKRKK